MMRVGLVEYINAYPFALALKEYSPIFGPPSEINSLFREQKLDLFVGSSIESLNTPYLLDVCVAAKGKIDSVNLYTKVDPTLIRRVKLDPNSGTSNALLKILLKEHWKVEVEFVTENPDAFLLIGDKALLNQKVAGHTTIDLATAWYELTALPFVFALLMHRPGVECSEISKKVEAVTKTNFVESAAKRFGMSSDFLADYFHLCRYHLGEEEKKGLELFVHWIRSYL